MQKLGLERSVDLGSQAADMGLDDAGLRIEVEIPDPLQQHRLGDDPAFAAHQHFEQGEFARLQLDRLAGAPRLAADQIELEIGNLQHRLLLLHRRPPAKRDGSGKRWLAALFFLGSALLPLAGFADEALTSQVRIEGERVWVEVSFTVAASRAEVWGVLTDFEHMAAFVSNVAVSKVVSRHGPVLQVYQKGNAHRGPLDFPFDVVREIHLSPMHRIQSHLLSGSMKQQDGVTELSDAGSETRVDYHAESVPGVWIPPVVGKSFIETEIRGQFQELEAEILRRHAAAANGRAAAE